MLGLGHLNKLYMLHCYMIAFFFYWIDILADIYSLKFIKMVLFKFKILNSAK